MFRKGTALAVRIFDFCLHILSERTLLRTNSLLISSHFPPPPAPLQIILEGKWSNFATLGISLIYLTAAFVPFQCRVKLQKKYSPRRKMAAAEEMNEEKILALARTAKDAIIFPGTEKEIFILFFFSFRNVFPSGIVCLNAGCKDLLVCKV